MNDSFSFPLSERDHFYADRLVKDSNEFEKDVRVYFESYSRFFENVFDPASVVTITELGCGIGIMTSVFLRLFPAATILAVDVYENVLVEPLRNNPRVRPTKALFTQFLKNYPLPEPDLTLLINTNITHGLDSNNIGLLVNYVGKGNLLSSGDCGDLAQSDWFLERFVCEKSGRSETNLWRAK